MRESYEKKSDYKTTSLISFNRGAKWQPLNPPTVSSVGTPINCKIEKGCSLHLHSFSTETIPYPYSVASAVGLIFGVGNLGKELTSKYNEMNTYLSRDGGLNWVEIKKGPWIMEIGDHGAIIVMAPMFKSTKNLDFSFDMGATFEKVRISEKLVDVDNIIVEPNSISLKFVMHGHFAETQQSKGLIVSVDFSQFGMPQCQGENRPGEEGSDYELWTPNDG